MATYATNPTVSCYFIVAFGNPSTGDGKKISSSKNPSLTHKKLVLQFLTSSRNARSSEEDMEFYSRSKIFCY